MQEGTEMTAENMRLFFAINLPPDLRQEISEKLLPLIPKCKWGRVLPENLHVTMHFLGYWPKDEIARLEKQVQPLQKFGCFEAEANCVGHFKGRVLWLGFGNGTEEFNLLNRKLQACLGTHDDRFHAHITLARNKGANKKEAEELVGLLGENFSGRAVLVKSLDLMQSQLRKAGPKYSMLFSVKLTQAHG